MNTTIPNNADRDLYATEAVPQLRRHHWQNLAGMVSGFRPEWPIDEVLESLWASRDLQDFPELAKLALAAALDPRCKTAASIRLAAQGLIAL